MKTLIIHEALSKPKHQKCRKLVMVESPLAGDLLNNVAYAKLGMLNCLSNYDESPMAFHLLYTQSLCDATDSERKLGIDTSFRWHDDDIKKVFYVDRGFSQGMNLSYIHASEKGIETEFRTMSKNDRVIDFVNAANRKILSGDDLIDLRKFLDSVEREGKLKNELALNGDKTGYSKESELDLAHIFSCQWMRNQNRDHKITYERLIMRKSILSGNAPIIANLIENQLGFIGGWLAPTWGLRADKIEVYADFGFGDSVTNTIKNSGLDFMVSSLDESPETTKKLNEINKKANIDSRLVCAMDMFNVKIDTVANLINNSKDKCVIDRVNKSDYSSEERAFSV